MNLNLILWQIFKEIQYNPLPRQLNISKALFEYQAEERDITPGNECQTFVYKFYLRLEFIGQEQILTGHREVSSIIYFLLFLQDKK